MPLLQYRNMPRAAQFFPDIHSLEVEKGIDLDVYQCSACGLVQLNSEPVPYYREVIRASGISEEMKEFRKRQFQEFVIEQNLVGKKIIEVGCGRGEYLSIMRQCNVECHGLEYASASVQECKKNGLNVFEGFIDHNNDVLVNAPYDAFFMLNFFEHIPDPSSVLQAIAKNLSDDGIGLIEVPNFDMIVKKNLFSEFISDHIFYFTKETLRSTLIGNGYEIISCKEVWHEYIISAVVKKRKMLDISNFYQCQERIKNELNDFVECHHTVAIWGAGHQALALISLSCLAGKISYIVDSASFKQNKYSPATHIPIVSPERLMTDPVDAVIIMAASYSDEIAKIIHTYHTNTMAVSIVRDHGLEIVNR